MGLFIIDETSVKTNMAKTTGWAPRGERLVDHAPFGHWRTRTFIAALRHDRPDAPWVIDGPINRDLFDLYIETRLAPTLLSGDVIIPDNLSSHKSPKAAQILRDIGAWFLPLPPEPMMTYGKPSVLSATCSPKTSASTTSSPQDTNPNERDTLMGRRQQGDPDRRRIAAVPPGCHAGVTG